MSQSVPEAMVNCSTDNWGRPEISDKLLYYTNIPSSAQQIVCNSWTTSRGNGMSVVRTHSVSLHEAGWGGEASIKCMNDAWAVSSGYKLRPTYALRYSDE